jgi:hypothetical protein
MTPAERVTDQVRQHARRARDVGRRRVAGWINFHGHGRLEDRRRGRDRCLIVLAGYKPHLWAYTLARVGQFVPDSLDVCLVSAGLYRSDLSSIAARHDWSYLAVRERNISLAQNLAIRAHDRARWIYKLDEDIFVEAGFFDALFDGYTRAAADGAYKIGMCAPVINVNGFSYVEFLRTLNLGDAYRDRFGELTRAGDGIPAWSDGAAAVWLWERSLPLDETAAVFAAQPFGYSTVPHRFNIGAVLYRRELWEELGGLRVSFPARIRPALGEDEVSLCASAITHSRVTCVVHNVFAGHFGFGPQEQAMMRALPDMADRLMA